MAETTTLTLCPRCQTRVRFPCGNGAAMAKCVSRMRFDGEHKARQQAADERRTMHVQELPDDTAAVFDSMLKQIVLLLVEKLGGDVEFSVAEVDRAPIGKKMSFEVDREAPGGPVFKFKVEKVR